MSFLSKLLALYLAFDKSEKRVVVGHIFSGSDVLLVKHTYGEGGWTFPGGFAKKTESAETALRREIFEETGLTLARVKLFDESPDKRKGMQNTTLYRFYAESETREYVTDTVENKLPRRKRTRGSLFFKNPRFSTLAFARCSPPRGTERGSPTPSALAHSSSRQAARCSAQVIKEAKWIPVLEAKDHVPNDPFFKRALEIRAHYEHHT